MSMNPLATKLKASLYTLTVLQLRQFNLEHLEEQLKQWIERSPNFFQGLPIILDLQGLVHHLPINLIELIQCLKQYGLIPIGIQGGTSEQKASAYALGMASFSTSLTQKDLVKTANTRPDPVKIQNTAKIITHPVRSGQQIYAKGDLVVLGSVSPGAELLAEGSIHVYGKLFGRALAGISNNNQAYIFCYDIQAELVAIAGNYWLHEDLQKNTLKSHVCLYLAQDQLQIKSLDPSK